ncbi:MAG: hypothetical protein M0002_12425 [Rhodospirillales bacterium]|nr:hypothetical protein [Rhodospirillales bacterium]
MPRDEEGRRAAMAETVSNPEAPVTPEMLLDDREHFWSGFYHFVWTVAAFLALLLILMAYFLV